MEKYTKPAVPDESTLLKTYLPGEYQKQMNAIKQKTNDEYKLFSWFFLHFGKLLCVPGKDIYIIVDECTDVTDRAVAALLVGVLDGFTDEKPQFFEVVELEQTNNSTITQFVNSTRIKLLMETSSTHG